MEIGGRCVEPFAGMNSGIVILIPSPTRREVSFVPSAGIACRELIGQKGRKKRFDITIRIGKPFKVNAALWACPVAIDGLDKQLADMHGVDSWQALLFALRLVRLRLEHFIETGGKLYWRGEPLEEINLSQLFSDNNQ